MTPYTPTPRSRLARFFEALASALAAFASFLVVGGAITVVALAVSHRGKGPHRGDGFNPVYAIGWEMIDAIIIDSSDGSVPAWSQASIYAYAHFLARHDGSNDPKVWFSRLDLVRGIHEGEIMHIYNPEDKRQLDPKFDGAALGVAVALFSPEYGKHLSSLSSDAPIVWTRGLQANGTWRADSPYGGEWGFVFFLSGYWEKYDSINRKLFKWGTKEPTSNILEALPPGTRIGEYTPTPEDLVRGREFAEREQRRKQLLALASWSVPLLLTFGLSVLYSLSPKQSPWRYVSAQMAVVCAFLFWLSLPK